MIGEFLSSKQVYEILKVVRPLLPIEYHEEYRTDIAMRGMPQIILNGVQFFTPRHAHFLTDTPYDKHSHEMLNAGRLDESYVLTLSNIEQRLSELGAWSKYGNVYLTHGCDRCDCGCKYWVNDVCQSCGFEFNIYQHKRVSPQVNNGEAIEDSLRGKLAKEVLL
jgi:hypothetical protein